MSDGVTDIWVSAGGVSRSNKRYFYCNELSGETQWNYPEQDIVGGGEAMDICTTPPPNDVPHVEVQHPQPPSPPRIGPPRSPSPPPPPIITVRDNCTTGMKFYIIVLSYPHRNFFSEDYQQPPLPPLPLILEATPPPPPPPLISPDQPPPPGVDSIDQSYKVPIKNEISNNTNKEKNRDSFGSELDSFYSDIAMIEATTSNVETTQLEKTSLPAIEPTDALNPVIKKKKKSKVLFLLVLVVIR